MNSKLARWCDGLLEAGWLSAIVLIPLFFNIHSDRVFEPDKLTLLRSIAVFMLAVWLVKFVEQRGWERLNWLKWKDASSIWRMPFVLPVALIALVYLLSTLFSITPGVSWAGSYQRLQGTYTTLSYITIFGLMIATIRERPQLDRIITTLIITSIPVSLYAMLQHFALDPLPWGGETQARVAGHMGNSIFVSAYLILAIPFTLSRILDAFTHILSDEELDYADVIRSSIYIFALAIQLIAIYWTRSRGPTLGLGVSMFAFVLILLVALRNSSLDAGRLQLKDVAWAVLYVLVGILAGFFLFQTLVTLSSQRVESLAGAMGSFVAFVLAIGLNVLGIFILMAARKGWRWLWMAWILVAVFVAGWLALFNVADEIAAANPPTSFLGRTSTALAEWQELPAVGRFGQMLDTDSRTAKVRVWIWQGALDLISIHEPLSYPDGTQDRFNFLRPLLGYGPESMYVAYNKFYVPELATIEARNASPDRAHNETFDALVITGLAGFLVWQLLYLSIFYYGFRWLGVVRTPFERNLLLGLWFLVGTVLTIIFVRWQGIEFFGVAFPFGNIAGLVLYLIYYALFAQASEGQEKISPFHVDRLLMIALVSAVLGHFVEIHFGIAIAATRLHFFVFAALMFLLGYRLHQIGQETIFEETHTVAAEEPVAVVEEKSGRKSNRRRVVRTGLSSGEAGWLTPFAFATLVLALIVGTMGFQFMNFIAAPGEQFQSVQDIPKAAEILRRAFFIHPGRDFIESPYIFLIIIFSWALGTMVSLSEMIKQGLITVPVPARKLPANQQQIAAFIYLGLFVLALVSFIVRRQGGLILTANQSLGQGLLLIGAGLTLLGGLNLLLNTQSSYFIGKLLAVVSCIMAFPLFVAGALLPASALLLIGIVLLVLLWDQNRGTFFMLLGSMALVSLFLGLLVSYLQASQIHFAFYAPTNVAALTEVQRRVTEAENSTGFLNLFYSFVFTSLVLFGSAAAFHRLSRLRETATLPGLAALGVTMIAAAFIISITNVRVIHADIIYKRARPWDTAAIRERVPAYWDNSIGIYRRAIELAPNEDFYYLWLGRAYLEKSGLLETAAERDALLNTAESELKTAQSINPLNTDHTANLARLYARWAGTTTGPTQAQLVAQSEAHYAQALTLSPQNAVLRNEYGRLVMSLGNDCSRAVSIFTDSIRIDPYYSETRNALVQAYSFCAASLSQDEKAQILQAMEESIPRAGDDATLWLQLGQLYQEAGNFGEAVNAYEEARRRATEDVPAWAVDFRLATLYYDQGDEAQARTLAEQALAAAPSGSGGEIITFLAQFGGELRPLTEGRLLGEGEMRPLAIITPTARNEYYDSYPTFIIDPNKRYDAIILTEKGEIRLRLFANLSPQAVNSFVFLATQGFYDGLTFHNVLTDYIAQGGDPTGSGQGGPGYTFNDEISNGLVFSRAGLVAIPNQGPNTNGSQFFITMVPTPGLNGRYTIFGELIEGMDVVKALTPRTADGLSPDAPSGELILRIDVYEFP